MHSFWQLVSHSSWQSSSSSSHLVLKSTIIYIQIKFITYFMGSNCSNIAFIEAFYAKFMLDWHSPCALYQVPFWIFRFEDSFRSESSLRINQQKLGRSCLSNKRVEFKCSFKGQNWYQEPYSCHFIFDLNEFAFTIST